MNFYFGTARRCGNDWRLVNARRNNIALLLAMICIWMTGCGPSTGDISGTVSFEGKQLPSGRITFLCEGGDKPVLMSVIDDGSYVINDAPIGNAQVTVETFETTTTAVPNMIASPSPPDQEGQASSSTEYVRIPTRYKARSTSGLKHEIVAGDQARDFELTTE